jgi:hypothetical protein
MAGDPLPPGATYRPLPTLPFSAVKANDEAQKSKVVQRQCALLSERYDFGIRSTPDRPGHRQDARTMHARWHSRTTDPGLSGSRVHSWIFTSVPPGQPAW